MNIFEITIQRKYQQRWPVVVEHTKPGQFVPIRNQGILQINDDIAALRALTGQPEKYGAALGKALFHNDIRDAFSKALATLGDGENENNYLHVLLNIEADDLKELRWEKLCVPLDGKWIFLSLNQRTPFSLYIPAITEQLFPAIGRRDLQALVVAASPSGLGRFQLDSFDVDAAVASIKTSLSNQIPCDVLAKVDGAIGLPSLDALLQCLTNNEKYYTLVHFICHGKLLADGETAIYLSTDDNQVAPVNATNLINRLSKLRRAPHFVFLSTCESASNTAEATGAMGGLAQRLVRELGIPAVVAMTDKVSIKTAQALATTFYQKLRVHGNIDLALSEATAGLQGRYDITVPALFSRLGGRPLFSDTPDRPLTSKEIKYGLDYLAKLLPERAPILSDELNQQITLLNRTLDTETKEALQEQQQALDTVNKICSEVLDLSFPALALGKEPPAYDSRCPFRGLYPFRLEDREFFFGREQLIAQLQEKLAQDNFLPVLGASGSGKSSVVLAGLIPALQSQQPNLQMAYMTPTSEPITVLQTSLSTFQSQNFVLVIDQFEELFTLCSDEAQRQKFIDKLISFSQQQKLIITMRADFWGECATFPKLKEMMQVRQELIAPMDSAELRRAMEMQAAIVGLRFEVGLSNSILDEVEGEPGAMPLLQHALFELWKRRQGRWLRCQQYEAIGGVKKAISQTADAVYNGLSSQQQEQVRNIFVRLTRLDEEAVQGDKRRDTRRRVELEELVPVGGEQAEIKKLVKYLAGEGARLVVTSVDSGTHGEEVEVAHEALIRYWPRLQNWLNENRINLQLREKIREAALDWNQNQRQEEYLELQGGRLGYAKELSKQPYFLNKLETEYVDACLELRDRQKKQEEERRQRELKQARKITVGSIAALAIMTVLTGLAGYAWQQSKRQQVEAYAATGKALLATNPTEGLVNAIAAVGLTRSPLVNFPNYTMPASVQSSLFSAVQISHEINTFQGDQGRVSSVAISSDGKTIVSGGVDGTVRLWGSNGQPLTEPFKGHQRRVSSVAISSDGKTIVSGGDDGTVRLWGINGQPLTEPFKGHQRRVSSVAISSDGKTIVSGGFDGTVRLWGSNGQPLGEPFKGHQDVVSSVAISSDGKTIVSGGVDGTVRLWGSNGQPLTEPFKADQGSVSSVAISSDGKTIVSGGFDGTVRLWGSNGQPLTEPFKGHQGVVNSVAISSDGKTIVSGGDDGTVRLWGSNGQPLTEPFKGHQRRVSSVAISSDGKTIVSGGVDGTVRLWGSNGQPLAEPFKGHQDVVSSVAISSDGKTIVSGGVDGTVRLWGSNGQPLAEPFKGHQDVVSSVAISSDGKTIVSGGVDGTVRLWGSNGQPLTEPFKGHQDVVSSVAISSDGKTIVSGGFDGTVRLWGSNGQPLGEPFKGHQGSVRSVAISSDGKTIVSGGDDGTVRLWGSNGQPLGEPFKGHQDVVRSVAISSDGKTIVSGGDDGTVRLWGSNGQPLGEPFKGHQGSVRSVAISSDGKTIVSGGDDGTVRLWGSNGQPLGEPFKGHQDVVRSVAISSDGKTIVSGGDDGTVRLWDMNLEHWMKTACERLRYHVILTKPKDAVAKEAKGTCEQYWNLQQ
jgi:WD40 repeat protein